MPSAPDLPMKVCPYCGEAILASAQKCRHCRQYLSAELRAQHERETHGAVDRMLMPVGRPVSAIAAGYLGLFSLLPFFGIPAIIMGVIALRVLKKNPGLSGRGRAIFGLVMGLVTSLFYGFFIVMALIESARIAGGGRP